MYKNQNRPVLRLKKSDVTEVSEGLCCFVHLSHLQKDYVQCQEGNEMFSRMGFFPYFLMICFFKRHYIVGI